MKFKLSQLVYVISAIILVVSGVYGMTKFREREAKLEVISSVENELRAIEGYKKDSLKEYQEASEQSQKTQTEIARRLEKIMPSKESFTDLTRELDDFFNKNYNQKDIIVAGSLNFLPGMASTDENSSYMVLPFSMNIESSKTNFEKFLTYVENSGTLKSMNRLIDIESINMNFGGESGEERITFSVNMNAYFQKTE